MTAKSCQKGFTLVEICVALVVIGLLIGGILKGQELIGNSKVTAAASKADGIKKAMQTFRSNYKYLPGDMINPGAVLQNCNAPICSRAGNGDMIIGTPMDASANPANIFRGATANPNNENTSAWAQLSASGIYTETAPNPSQIEFSISHPPAPGGGGFFVLFNDSDYSSQLGITSPFRSGHFVQLVADAQATPASASTGGLWTGNQMKRLDSKVDDGMPNTGSVISVNPACASGPDRGGTYDVEAGGCSPLIFLFD